MKLRAILSLILLSSFSLLFAYVSPGKPSGFVNDFAHVLTQDQVNSLEQQLREFNASTTNEIAVVTVPSLQGDYIEHYAVKLFGDWKIGKEKQDNGVLLLIALDEHKVRLEVGYGLEGALPDALASDIIRNDITPLFKQNDYYGGIQAGLTDVMQATKGEYVSSKEGGGVSGASIEHAFILIIVAVQFLAAILGRSKSWWAGGVLGAVAGAIITYVGVLGITTFIGIIVTVVLTLLGLVFDYVVSNAYTRAISRGGSVPWWVGGGGRSGGSSFGGFGGGSSGGGGASGSW